MIDKNPRKHKADRPDDGTADKYMDQGPTVYKINPRQQVVIRNGFPVEVKKKSRGRRRQRSSTPDYECGIIPYGVSPQRDAQPRPREGRPRKTRRDPGRSRSEEPQIMPFRPTRSLPASIQNGYEHPHLSKPQGDKLQLPTLRYGEGYSDETGSSNSHATPVITSYDNYYPPPVYSSRKSGITECFRTIFYCMTCKCLR